MKMMGKVGSRASEKGIIFKCRWVFKKKKGNAFTVSDPIKLLS